MLIKVTMKLHDYLKSEEIDNFLKTIVKENYFHFYDFNNSDGEKNQILFEIRKPLRFKKKKTLEFVIKSDKIYQKLWNNFYNMHYFYIDKLKIKYLKIVNISK